jgi:hypothetical protein
VLCEVCGREWAVESRERGSYSRWLVADYEPRSWRDAATDRPDEVTRWIELYTATVERLGGDPDAIPGPLRFELSNDVIPPWLRLLSSAGEAGMVLRSGASIELWLRAAALGEVQRQRRSASDELPRTIETDVDEDEWADYDEPAYEPLVLRHPQFVRPAIDRYADVFILLAGIDQRHADDVRRSLMIDVSVDPPTVLRVSSNFTGETHWQDGWTGTLSELIDLAEEMAETNAHWVQTERHLTGATAWDDTGSADE